MNNEFISIKDWGAAFGYGLFETMRIYNGIPFLLEEHIERLQSSSRELSFFNVPDKDELRQLAHDYIKREALQNEALRLSVTYGNKEEGITPQVFITHRPVPYGEEDYKAGITVAISSSRKNEHSPLVRHKTFNQLENVLSLKRIKEQGVKECIFLNTAGYLAEGSKSNIFFLRGGSVFIPSIDCGLLPGITRAKIIALLRQQNLEVNEGSYNPRNLYECDECFCTNSLMEALPVTKIDGNLVGTGRPGEFAQGILSLYRQCIEKYGINNKEKYV